MRGQTLAPNISDLEDEMLTLGGTVERCIRQAMEACQNRNLTLARQVIVSNLGINQRRLGIEERYLGLTTFPGPVVSEVRIIGAVLNIIVELERIADHAAGMANIALMMGNEPLPEPLVDLPRMAKKIQSMLRRSLNCFINRDAAAAKRICTENDEVHRLYDRVLQGLLSRAVDDPRTFHRASHLIWIGHNLERSADRVTNICQYVASVARGKVAAEPPKVLSGRR